MLRWQVAGVRAPMAILVVAVWVIIAVPSLSQTSLVAPFLCCLALALALSSTSIIYISTSLRAKFFPRPSF